MATSKNDNDLLYNKEALDKQELLEILQKLVPDSTNEVKKYPLLDLATHLPKQDNEQNYESPEASRALAKNNHQEVTSKTNSIKINIHDKEHNQSSVCRLPKAALELKGDAFKEKCFTRGYVNLEKGNVFFNWFCKWMVNDPSVVINLKTVLPLLKLAEELNIAELHQRCSKYWKNHVCQIDYSVFDWSILQQETIIQFSELFANFELEGLSNQPELQNHLFQLFIQFLNEPTPRNILGHYATTSKLFSCKHCGKCLTPDVERFISCRKIQLDGSGNAEPSHRRDADWSLSEMVVRLRRNLQSWRMVYWKLWGNCHYVSCSVCFQLFPLSQMNWCLHHPISPVQDAVEASGSIPSYPCCKEQAYPFQSVPKKTGCMYKSHIPSTKGLLTTQTLEIYKKHKELIDIEPPSPATKSELQELVIPRDSEPCLINTNLLKPSKKYKIPKFGKSWSAQFTTGLNQDNQREKEEKIMKRLEKFLTIRCCWTEGCGSSPKPLGGLYVVAERECLKNLSENFSTSPEKEGSLDKNS